jgi:hypothetical protein
MELRIREVDKGGGGLTGTHASEAKGPFSRREEGWELGEEKEQKERKRPRCITHGQRGHLGRWLLPRKVPRVKTLLR